MVVDVTHCDMLVDESNINVVVGVTNRCMVVDVGSLADLDP